MDMRLLTVLLSICLTPRLSVGNGEDEDEALLHSFNSEVQESDSVLDACVMPEALRFEKPETQLQFHSKRHVTKSNNNDPRKVFEYGNRARICPAENTKDSSYEKPKTKPKIPKEEDYDDDDEGNDESFNNNNDNDDEEFITRVSNILRVLHENTKAMSTDVKELESGIFPAKSSLKCKSSKHKRPKKLCNVMVKEDYYSDVDNPVMHYAIINENGKPRNTFRSNCVANVKDNEANAQLAAVAQSDDDTNTELSYRNQQSDRIPLVDLQLPFMVPSASLLVPLLNRRSWSFDGPNYMERRRYLHALNELRLARAIQEAAAARYSHKQRSSEFQQHVDEFKENLRRLVSNRAVIERRVNGLLDGIHNPIAN